ncbi:hypothetical protein CU666_20490 [Pseudomonas syringae pv. actinidifoliorum]|nr:hypothetical protein [Pseudomonas syringae pv. actinidifoliorum]
MIRLTLRYWNKLAEEGVTDHGFVDIRGDSTFGESVYENWVRISQKDDAERINLAIVNLKDEVDFFNNRIFKFVEVLNGVGAVEAGFYKRIKYGTDEDLRIKLIRDGFSRGLADLMLADYAEMVRVGSDGEVHIDSRIVRKMMGDEVSDLMIFEVKMSIRV